MRPMPSHTRVGMLSTPTFHLPLVLLSPPRAPTDSGETESATALPQADLLPSTDATARNPDPSDLLQKTTTLDLDSTPKAGPNSEQQEVDSDGWFVEMVNDGCSKDDPVSHRPAAHKATFYRTQLPKPPVKPIFIKSSSTGSAWRQPLFQHHTVKNTPAKPSSLLAEKKEPAPSSANAAMAFYMPEPAQIWCFQTLDILRRVDDFAWWLRHSGSTKAEQHSQALSTVLESRQFKFYHHTIATCSLFAALWVCGLPANFSSALLLPASSTPTFSFFTPVDHLVILLIGGGGSILAGAQQITLKAGMATPLTLPWTGPQLMTPTDRFCETLHVSLSENNTMVVIFFSCKPQVSSRGTPIDPLQSAAKFSISPFSRSALLEQWVIVDALLEYSIFVGKQAPSRDTLPQLFSRIEFRPSKPFIEAEEAQPCTDEGRLIIHERIAAILAHYCTLTPEPVRLAFIDELISLAISEYPRVLACAIQARDIDRLWADASFWVSIINSLHISNTPLGSPVLGSFFIKKLSLKGETRHRPSSTTSTSMNIKAFVEDYIPNLISNHQQYSADNNKYMEPFRTAIHSPANSIRIAVPSFIADELAKARHTTSDSHDSWRAPLISELDLHGGDQRENSFAKPLGLTGMDLYAYPNADSEAQDRAISYEQAIEAPLTIHIDIELGMLRTGVALSSPAQHLFPLVSEATVPELLQLRRLQYLRACSYVPAIVQPENEDKEPLRGQGKFNMDRVNLHLLLGECAQFLHQSARRPRNRHNGHYAWSLEACQRALCSATGQVKHYTNQLITAKSLRQAMTDILLGKDITEAHMALPCAIRPLNLQDYDMLRFEPLSECDPGMGFLGTSAYKLTLQFRDLSIQMCVSSSVSASPVLCFVDKSNVEYRIDRFKEDSIKALPRHVDVSCLPTHAVSALSTVLAWYLQKDNIPKADSLFAATLVCAGLGIGSQICIPQAILQTTGASVASSIMECLLTAEVTALIQGQDHGYPIVRSTTSCPIRAIATAQGVLFPQHNGKHLSLTYAAREDVGVKDRTGSVYVELQGSGEAVLFRFVDENVTWLAPGVTVSEAEEAQTRLDYTARPPLAAHIITYGAIGSSVRRVLPLNSGHPSLELPATVYWFWVRLEDSLLTNNLTHTLLKLASSTPGCLASPSRLRTATFLVLLLYKAEGIHHFFSQTVVLIHLVANALGHFRFSTSIKNTQTFTWRDLVALQRTYSFAFRCYTQFKKLIPKGNLLHLRLWYTSLAAAPDLAYDASWEVSLIGSLRRVENINMRPKAQLDVHILMEAIKVSVVWCYPQLHNQHTQTLRALALQGERDPMICYGLFAMGIPPLWCLLLSRVAYMLDSNPPDSPSKWWKDYKDLLYAFSDSFALEVFTNTEQMLSQSKAIALLRQLTTDRLGNISFAAFLREFEPALVGDLQIAASFLLGDKAVPHHWSASGLLTLSNWIDQREFRKSIFKLVRYPLIDWHHTFVCCVLIWNSSPKRRKVSSTGEPFHAYLQNWHCVAHTLGFLPHISAVILGRCPRVQSVISEFICGQVRSMEDDCASLLGLLAEQTLINYSGKNSHNKVHGADTIIQQSLEELAVASRPSSR